MSVSPNMCFSTFFLLLFRNLPYQNTLTAVAAPQPVRSFIEDNTRLLLLLAVRALELIIKRFLTFTLPHKYFSSLFIIHSSLSLALANTEIADILEYAFVPSLSADNVQKGRSMLSGIGAEVASGGLDIFDDGLRAGGIGTSQADDEGTPSQKTAVIEDGILKGHL